jgi:HSF-type DNA-binding
MYHDFANIQDVDVKDLILKSPSSEPARNNHAVVASFPEILHYMLNEIKRDGLDHIVSWLPHGRCIMVHKQKEFEHDVIPL